MKGEELAARLMTAHEAERAALLRERNAGDDVSLAYALKDICLVDGWSGDPARCTGAAEALRALRQLTPDEEVAALSLWCDGMAEVVRGRNEQALQLFNEAEEKFLALGLQHTAAQTQVIKLYALAMLGRYDEAIECGLRARGVFIEHDDQLAAGKIENNIGNIYFRRDRYPEAERFQSLARDRFTALKNQTQLAKINNCLANTHALLHRFRSAEQLYEQALAAARTAGLTVTQAEIEGNMGNMALFRGHYDRALDWLERSRRQYAALDMPHQSAIAELEIADAYLELNLLPEASAIYARVTPTFAELRMQAEQARALAQHGRVALSLGQIEQAEDLLAHARELYLAEGNAVGAALVTLSEAQIHYSAGRYDAAIQAAATAADPLAIAGNWRHLLSARWLHGESLRAQGKLEEARALLQSTLHDAEQKAQPQVAQRCHTSLGMLAAASGMDEAAEAEFKRAIALIETLRAPLPSEEFRAAFFGDKLAPYDELVRLYLKEPTDTTRIAAAFEMTEKARARALADMLEGELDLQREARDVFETQSLARLAELREELNWFYSRLNRPTATETTQDGAAIVAELNEAARTREQETLAIMRQLQHRGLQALPLARALDIRELQRDLGTETALVEYMFLDDECLAFIVTECGIEVVSGLGSETEIRATLEKVRFQIKALRYGRERMTAHLPQLNQRIQSHLRALYESLLAPIEPRIGERRLMIVPHRVLHYVPFQALYDGESYLIERREVAYAPSATVLRHCLSQPQRPTARAVLFGVPDERAPRVRDEILALAPLFPSSVALLEEEATLRALDEHAPSADVLHLACHGQFRPDNPRFSSLRLSDGNLTVRDAGNLKLQCALVTLSACETGVSAVSPGDELIGLARGFFSAGAPSLLLSLWTVDDAATVELMTDFYTRLRAGAAPAAALRAAQIQMLRRGAHPCYWAAFVLLGRW